MPKTCPICGKSATEQHRPFCSARCANIDLGRWLGEKYSIPAEEDTAPLERHPDESRDDAPRERYRLKKQISRFRIART